MISQRINSRIPWTSYLISHSRESPDPLSRVLSVSSRSLASNRNSSSEDVDHQTAAATFWIRGALNYHLADILLLSPALWMKITLRRTLISCLVHASVSLVRPASRAITRTLHKMMVTWPRHSVSFLMNPVSLPRQRISVTATATIFQLRIITTSHLNS